MTPKQTDTPAPITITLTIPEPGSDGSLLAQRGDLAHISQFAHTTATDFTQLIRLAVDALTVVEADPPVVPEPPSPPRQTKTTRQPATPPEPTLQVPVKGKKKGRLTKTIPARCLQLPESEADQKLVLKLAGKLLDSGLWDGEIPIRITDTTTLKSKLQGLTLKEINGLFTLDQFVEVNPPDTTDANTAATDEAELAEQTVPTD